MMPANATTVNRYRNLETAELLDLVRLDLDNPRDGIDADPSTWHSWTDEWVWEPNDYADHSAADEADACELFGAVSDQEERDDYVTEDLEDDSRPRDTWTPSRVEALEHQEAR